MMAEYKTTNNNLHDRVFTFINDLDLALDGELKEDLSLIKSGLIDSLALWQLFSWIERELHTPLDPTSIDLREEWDTIADIVKFMEKHGK